MGTKGRSTPRVVCCAIPISKTTGKVLVVQSRKRKDRWVCKSISIIVTGPGLTFFLVLVHLVVPKGGWEPSDKQLEAAASREAFEEGPPRFPLIRRANS